MHQPLPLGPPSLDRLPQRRIGHRRCDGTPRQQLIAAVQLKIAVGHPIPILGLSETELLAQPAHIAPPIPAIVPEANWLPREPPLAPVVLREQAPQHLAGRATVVIQDRGTVVASEILARDGVPLLHAPQSQLMRQPQQLAAAVVLLFPELRPPAARAPHGVDPVCKRDRLPAEWLLALGQANGRSLPGHGTPRCGLATQSRSFHRSLAESLPG